MSSAASGSASGVDGCEVLRNRWAQYAKEGGHSPILLDSLRLPYIDDDASSCSPRSYLSANLRALDHDGDDGDDDSDDGSENDATRDDVRVTLRPLTAVMKLLGLFPFPHGRSCFSRTWPILLAITNVTLSWLYFLRSLKSLTGNDVKHFFSKVHLLDLENSMWLANCAFNASFVLYVCVRRDYLSNFFRQWEQCSAIDHGNAVNQRTSLRRWMLVYTVLDIVFIIHAFLTYCLICFHFRTSDHAYIQRLTWPLPGGTASCVLVVVMETLCMCNFVIALTLFMIICIAFQLHFRAFKHNLEEIVAQDNAGKFRGSYRECREQYQELARLLSSADRVFSPFLLVAYLIQIPSICILLYASLVTSLISTTPLTPEDIVYAIFTTNPVFYLVSLSAGGASVHNMAHSPLLHIHDIQTTKTRKEQYQISMLAQRLKGCPIGFSAWTLFTIDRPTILTVSGVFITYFVLLVQFQLSANYAAINQQATSVLPEFAQTDDASWRMQPSIDGVCQANCSCP